jgi:hypothetical protein
LILLPLRANLLCILHYETPCIRTECVNQGLLFLSGIPEAEIFGRKRKFLAFGLRFRI